ncbi:MAG: fucose isomerase [Candidatus Marinimicrobia bacterium]|nr:fucose isomerase [Candidatus Neomarinimicrobiota bacterium]
MTQPFGFIFVNSLFVPEGEAFTASMKQYAVALQGLGGIEMTIDSLDVSLPLVYFMTTGGTEQVLLDIRQQRSKDIGDEPVLIVAYPAHNSLPASLEVLARLQQDGAQGQILYLKKSSDSKGLQKIQDVLTVHRVAAELKRSRIGLLGAPSDWLVASSPEHSVVQESWGPEVVPVSLDEINRLIKEVPSEDIPAVLNPLVEGATDIQEPCPADLDNVVRVYLALKQVIEKYDLDALTIRCFDLVLGLETTGCFGLSQLTDEGIIAGCEGDLVSTVGLLWAKKLTGQTPWMANPAQLDEVGNKIILAHCTVPRSMVQDYGLRSHFESNLGVGIQGTIANGPVTLLRIGGKKMEQLWLAEGQIIESGKAEDLCRTQVEIKLSDGHISALLEAPLGNHLVMVQGHHLQHLQSWWKQMIA